MRGRRSLTILIVFSDVTIADAESLFETELANNNTIITIPSQGADKTAFEGWSLADAIDALADF